MCNIRTIHAIGTVSHDLKLLHYRYSEREHALQVYCRCRCGSKGYFAYVDFAEGKTTHCGCRTALAPHNTMSRLLKRHPNPFWSLEQDIQMRSGFIPQVRDLRPRHAMH